MRKVFTILAAILLTASLYAQAPEKMSYQAVIRNTSNNLVTGKEVGMKISILQGSISGIAVYVETHTPTSNANGLVSLEIGTGTVVSGDFSAIDWAAGPFFIKTETAVESPLTTYTITGISQLLSVPYALYAKSAESLTGTITETDPAYTASQAANITATDITNLGNLSGINTGDQDLSGLATIANVNTALDFKVDKEAGKALSTNDYTTLEKSKLAAISGTNTGDQDLSSLASKAALGDSIAQVRSEIPDVSGFLSSETDPTFTSSQAANITTTDITNLGNLSGINTGDQDLSGLSTIANVNTALGLKVDKEAGKALSTNDYTTLEKSKLAAISGTNTGDQDLSGLATTATVVTALNLKVDKEAGKALSTNDYTTLEKSKLAAISGTNTGDQDLSGLATTATVVTALDLKVDKEAGKALSTNDYTTLEKSKLAAISGTNTGDQDLSSLATKTALSDSISQLRTEIPAIADGSETMVTSGTNVNVTGSGTTGNPYVINSTGGILAFAEFYAMMPNDNPATVAPGTAVDFPQNGPSSGTITRLSSDQFLLPDIGVYMVSWQVSFDEAGQLVLDLNGTQIPYTVVGRATGTSQITGNSLIATTSSNSILSVLNPPGNPLVLTITPFAGGSKAVSASLVIMRIQ